MYNVGDKFVAKRNYLDIFKKDEEYEVYQKENNLGTDMWYVKDITGKKISVWGLKEFELKIMFTKK